jgi:hypothetical protein
MYSLRAGNLVGFIAETIQASTFPLNLLILFHKNLWNNLIKCFFVNRVVVELFSFQRNF